ncbi:hypothetical protein ACIGDI_01475 [Streptomyces sp. NPDC085900]|uniref:hypothetical protein n=1 Tax=Streptomyces sp. NPDC085900 TaxID=3365737 RepID=UPI0037D397E2
MRALPARRIASTALCAALLVGIAAPAAVAAGPAAERAHAESRTPVPGADTLLGQVQSLSGLGGVLTPVTDLLSSVLQADNGRLSDTEAAELSTAVKDAIAKVTAAMPTAPSTATTPTPPTTPAAPATPAASTPPATPATPAPPLTPATPVLPAAAQATTLPALVKSGTDVGAPSSDVLQDALASLRKAIDDLVAAATTGDADEAASAVDASVTGLVNAIAATLLDGKLPAPTLTGLPSVPAAGLPN